MDLGNILQLRGYSVQEQHLDVKIEGFYHHIVILLIYGTLIVFIRL